MNQFLIFARKELLESVATFRLWIFLGILAVLGLASPLLAQLMPRLFEGLGDLGVGFDFLVQEPTALDSWFQFFSNVGQLGMLTLIIIFSGIMSSEIRRGTLINLLTKGLKRRTVILSKFVSASVLWTLAYMLSLVICLALTAHFWDLGTVYSPVFTFISPWLYGLFMLSLLIFGGTLFGNNLGSLLSCLGVTIGLSLLSVFRDADRFNPLHLAGATWRLLAGHVGVEEFLPAFIICAVLTVALICGSIIVFDRKKL